MSSAARASRRILIALVMTLAFDGSSAEETPALDDATFDTLHTLIAPRRGESRWMEIDWYPSVHEARVRAAAEGKPILLVAGSGGAPAAGC